ncbi:MAG: 30S ribosomal protein S21 [Candidatus Omnitrophica bacterium]|nr:30S ribosomal protein S21 [Candidatus Omnitrophota bacterium]MBU1048273.1 30S ribosomal protein S21 [Candidatus Omnitrophota bacterium]MBU1630386.1 30S ribosomal protein S21 [Candidatus Omnitrophota bacterium]MBU1767642.1 30S ribosomal protein S21 [Candidatus Omnitrophota bacterium]MBU1888685.1 30S ribosomal protein S21 [Candidatus Omnitrophota bacterium]
MPHVKLDKGEPLDKVLRKFKRQLEREGLFKELRRREFYEKPTEKRRKKYLKTVKKIAYARRHPEA